MCGRATLVTPVQRIIEGFLVREWLESEGELPRGPRYNVRPTDPMCVVWIEDGRRVMGAMRWGFRRPWTRRPLFNARAEEVDVNDTWADAFAARRCLVVMDGFYEWPKDGGRGAQASYVRLASGEPLAAAGLYERDGDGLACTVCTCAANELVQEIPHPRMPVILPAETQAAWLDPGTDEPALRGLLRPLPAERMVRHVVGPAVNRGADGPECVEPAAVEEPGLFDQLG